MRWCKSTRIVLQAVLVLLSFGSFCSADVAISIGRQTLAVRSATAHSVRITLAPAGLFGEPVATPDAFSLLPRKWPELHAISTDLSSSTAKVGAFNVDLRQSPLSVLIKDAAGSTVQELTFDRQADRVDAVHFPLGDRPLLGLGEGDKQFDRRGSVFGLRNGQGRDTTTNGARIDVPLLIGTEGWALLVLSSPGTVDLRSAVGSFEPPADSDGSFDVLIFDAKSPAALMKELSDLTGPAVMPPRWALGYMQSCRTLETDVQLLEIARTFREKKLPCDAMIYLGTGFCPAGWNNGFNSLEFNRRVFVRDPAEVIRDLHALNFHVVVHTIPPRQTNLADPATADGYWKDHRPVFSAGVDGWWPDEGDWLGVAGRLGRHRLYYQGPLSDRPNERPWNLQRNGYLGIARYGGWVWSGDVASTWKTLAAQVSVGLNSSLSVSPFWGTDTGGFLTTAETDGELYARWIQFSAFCPSFRSHGRPWHIHLPWGWDSGDTGPMEDQKYPAAADLHDPRVEKVWAKYLALRYALLPYNYTLARQARDTGMPMMRSLWLTYPTDAQAAGNGSEYLWGPEMLVAPVVEKGASEREVYLPAGNWYDWWTGEKCEGGRRLHRPVDLETIPIYVKAGAIVPLDPPKQYADQPSAEPITVRVYAGADGSFTLYEDDGRSQDYLTGVGVWTRFDWDDTRRTLRVANPQTRGAPKSARVFDVVFEPDHVHKRVGFDGSPVTVSADTP